MKYGFYYKLMWLFIFIAFGQIPLTSCTKDSPAPSYSIQGLWTGNQISRANQSSSWTMSLKAYGTATYENVLLSKQQFCAGTWTLSGTAFTCNTVCIYGLSYNVGVHQTFTAVFDKTTGTLSSGIYVNTYPPASVDSGTFTLTQVR